MLGSGPHGLTGVWDGNFSYPRVLSPVSFTMVILEIGTAISGTVHENPTDGPSAGRTLIAAVEGERTGNLVQFTKVYEGAGRPHRRPIRYDGTLDPDGNEIAGRWMISDPWSGKFVMVRSGQPPVAAASRRKASVPVV